MYVYFSAKLYVPYQDSTISILYIYAHGCVCYITNFQKFSIIQSTSACFFSRRLADWLLDRMGSYLHLLFRASSERSKQLVELS